MSFKFWAFIGFGTAVLLWLALAAFEWRIRQDENSNVKKDVKIERLEDENKTKDEVIQIRKKQNEIRNNRPDTDALIDSLRRGTF